VTLTHLKHILQLSTPSSFLPSFSSFVLGKVTINLQPSQLLQMAGRAGRRGKDTMGHVVRREGGWEGRRLEKEEGD